MNKISVYFLILQYPLLTNFIDEACSRGEEAELLSFIFELETDENVQFH